MAHPLVFFLRAACIYMDINLKPQERHRMFSERMTFWNMFTYKEMLEEHAVDNKEARMLIEIESAIDESEEDDVEDDEDEDEDAEEDEISGPRHGGGRRRGVQRRRKARLERRWRNLGGNRFNKKLLKKRNAAKLEARKRRRLAKKLRKMMDQ